MLVFGFLLYQKQHICISTTVMVSNILLSFYLFEIYPVECLWWMKLGSCCALIGCLITGQTEKFVSWVDFPKSDSDLLRFCFLSSQLDTTCKRLRCMSSSLGRKLVCLVQVACRVTTSMMSCLCFARCVCLVLHRCCYLSRMKGSRIPMLLTTPSGKKRARHAMSLRSWSQYYW